MKTRNYHRGDVFTVKTNPAWGYPDGEVFQIMIIQNDAGEIPCDTVTALRLKTSRNRRRPGWILHDEEIHRYDKHQLYSYMGRLPHERANALISRAEKHCGFQIPPVLEAP